MEINSQLLQQHFLVCAVVIGRLEYDSYSLGFNPDKVSFISHLASL